MAFTGSTATGRKVMMGAAAGPRAVSMELGGKSPLLVFEDAELDSAVDWILTGILWGSGQVDIDYHVLFSPSRLIGSK